MDQNQQFEDVIMGLKYGRDSLDPARYVRLRVCGCGSMSGYS